MTLRSTVLFVEGVGSNLQHRASHSVLGFKALAAFVAQLTAMGDRLHTTHWKCFIEFRRRPHAILNHRSWPQLDEWQES